MARCKLNYINFQKMLEDKCLGMGQDDPDLRALVHSTAAGLANKDMDIRSCVLLMIASSNQEFPEKPEFARRLAAFMHDDTMQTTSLRVILNDPLERCFTYAMNTSNIYVLACILECCKPLNCNASIRDLVFQVIRMVQQNEDFPGRDHLADIVDQFILDELVEAGRVGGDDVAS